MLFVVVMLRKLKWGGLEPRLTLKLFSHVRMGKRGFVHQDQHLSLNVPDVKEDCIFFGGFKVPS